MSNGFPISVVMPCYNSGQFVSYATESILKQSFDKFELIIINDGSTDESDSVIRKYLTDPRVKYIVFQQNKGNYTARNIGMKLAIGKYICVMDADDIAFPDRLRKQFRFMERHPKIGLAGSWAINIDSTGNVTTIIKKPESYNDIKIGLLIDNRFVHSSLILRNQLLKKHLLFYNEKLTYSADYDFVVRCSKKFKIVNTKDILIQYRVHQDQISSIKHREQVKFADYVRLKQLWTLQIKPTNEEFQLHLNLLKRADLAKNRIEDSLNWFNKILKSNQKVKIYNQEKLYSLLDFLLRRIATSIDK
jgi:glycosyltransferase involved in cell wall biosynthesis